MSDLELINMLEMVRSLESGLSKYRENLGRAIAQGETMRERVVAALRRGLAQQGIQEALGLDYKRIADEVLAELRRG